MKILLLHQYFNTPEEGGPLRSYYLARALVENGTGVVVITTHNKSDYNVDFIDGIEVHYLPVSYDNRFGFYKRSYAFLKYIFAALRLSSKFKDAKLCYAISVPLTIGILAIAIKKRHGIPFIFEVGDLWPDAPIQLGFVKSPVLKSLLYQLEKKVYKSALSVVALSEPIKNAILKKVVGIKVDVIPNMADTDFYYPQEKNPSLEKRFKTQGNFVVSYIGAVGYANGLDTFLECARESQRINLPVKFILCGDGAMVDKLKSVSKTYNLQNLEFIPFTNRDGVKEILNVTDAAYICYRSEKILETGSPNKYFDALAAGKIIIINFEGWIKDEIQFNECGFAIPANTPKEFVERLKPFLENQELVKKNQHAARSLAEQKYSRRKLGAAYFNLLNETANRLSR